MTELQSTETVEPEIIHLDFDPDASEPEKEPEKPKTCGLALPHLHARDDYSVCGRPAAYELSLKKPCGHHSDLYLCQPCWDSVESGQQAWFHCRKMTDGVQCGDRFKVRPAIVRWEKL